MPKMSKFLSKTTYYSKNQKELKMDFFKNNNYMSTPNDRDVRII